MKKLIQRIFIVLLLFTSIFFVMRITTKKEIKPFNTKIKRMKISKAVQKSTVCIFNINPTSFCSGVIVEESKKFTYVITNKHCISPSEETLVENKPVTSIITTIGDDLALVLVKGKIPSKVPTTFAKYNPVIGTELVHIGYPIFELYESWGTLLRTSKDWHWVNLDSIGGCSGGGVYNNNKELVGILWGRFRTKPVSIYEPIEDIKKFLKQTKVYLK